MESFALRHKTLGQLLAETTAAYPDNDAVVYVDSGLRLTWKELHAKSDAIAKGFMALGIEPGEKIAIWATNVPNWIEIMFAAAKIGAVMLTVNTAYRQSELEYLLAHSETENFVVIDRHRDFDFVATVYNMVPELRDLKNKERSSFHSKQLPDLKRVIFMGEGKCRGMYGIPEIMAFGENISNEEYAKRQAAVHPHDLVNMQYTSGTTGFPKGVMLSHMNILNNGYWIGRMQRFSQNDRVCIPVPLFHCFGCVLAVMACVNHGAAMITMSSFNPVQVMTTVEEERCTALYGVPSMFQSILQHRIVDRVDFSSLRTGIMAGSVCPSELMRKVIDKMHLPELTITYGLTETSPAMSMTSFDDTFEHRVDTAGRPLPGVDVRILHPRTSAELATGEVGEICCRGYNVMLGYYNLPEETDKIIDKNGFLHSGDLGFLDEDGYLHITGRMKDMIIRAGENIYPREIEEFISNMPGVLDVQVVAIPSRRYGEEVGAFIISAPGMDISTEDVKDFCRGKIAWHKIPRYIHFMDSYPMTASGKIQKYRLRELAAELFSQAMN